MKTLHSMTALLLILESFTLINCKKENNPVPVKPIDSDTIVFEHPMKGWELFSWPNGNDWDYSILIGTNRLKTYNEVTNNSIIVLGNASLKKLLDRFPKNEFIFWAGKLWLNNTWVANFGNLSLPDTERINDIKSYCTQRGLNLYVYE